MSSSTDINDCPCCKGRVLTEFWNDGHGDEQEADLCCLGSDGDGNDCQWSDTRTVPCEPEGCPAADYSGRNGPLAREAPS